MKSGLPHPLPKKKPLISLLKQRPPKINNHTASSKEQNQIQKNEKLGAMRFEILDRRVDDEDVLVCHG